jgi:hypothetical protein
VHVRVHSERTYERSCVTYSELVTLKWGVRGTRGRAGLDAILTCGVGQKWSSPVIRWPVGAHCVMRALAYNVVMAKGDFSTVTINDFSRGVNALDQMEDLTPGFIGHDSVNVIPVGRGGSIRQVGGLQSLMAFTSSPSRRPNYGIPYDTGLVVVHNDGSVSRFDFNTAFDTNFGTSDGAGILIPSVIIAQDVSLGTNQYVWIMRDPTSGLASTKVNLTTAASVAWAGTPPKGRCIANWKTRMVIGGIPSEVGRLRFSDALNPESWPVNNFIDVKTTDGDAERIIGLEVVGEDLLVFKERSTWLVFDPVTFDNRRLFSVGLYNRKFTCRYNDRVYWMDSSGIYSTDGTDVSKETASIDAAFSNEVPNSFGGGGFNVPYATGSVDYYGGMDATLDGRIVVSSGAGIIVGYVGNRDQAGRMAWYHLNGGAFASSWDVIQTYPGDYLFAGELVILTRAPTNFNEISLYDSGSSHLVGGTNVAVKGVIQLPPMHNDELEAFSRMRKLDLYGVGTIGSTGVATIEVRNDTAVGPAFSKVPGSFSTEFIRVRPEVRGRNFYVTIKGDGTGSSFTIHAVEAVLRRAGR